VTLRPAGAPSYDDLAARLADAEAALEAVAAGAVDALASGHGAGGEIIALERADSFFVTLVTEMQEATASLDSNGTLLYANPRFAELLGLPLSRVLGRTLAELTAKAERAAARRLLAEAARGPARGALELLRGDGRLVPVSVSAAPIAGERPEVCLVATDLTERKQAEITLRRSREQIERQNAELERQNAELGQFAYLAAHDLNEPLRVIGGFVQLLQRRYDGQLDERADTFIQATVDGVARMQAMIDALLNYSRVEQSKVGADKVDCNRAVGEARLNLHHLISDRHADLQIGELPTIPGEPASIGQLFQNLISNAVKYGDPRNPWVEVSAQQADGNWVFSVEDNGAGIDADQSERVFEMFKRLHGRDQAGTGIGLAICKRIVEKYGGRIWVEPRATGGSAFRFTVPTDGRPS
jgi:PAS domain S-box-containing protein